VDASRQDSEVEAQQRRWSEIQNGLVNEELSNKGALKKRKARVDFFGMFFTCW